jgi:hypothetical protein
MDISPLEAAMSRHRAEAARILRGVAALFSEPARWTQGAWARDADGMNLVRAHDSRATCWCLVGAVRKVRGPGMSAAEGQAIRAIRRVLCPTRQEEQTPAEWNDDSLRTVDEVRSVAIQAAELLEARP